MAGVCNVGLVFSVFQLVKQNWKWCIVLFEKKYTQTRFSKCLATTGHKMLFKVSLHFCILIFIDSCTHKSPHIVLLWYHHETYWHYSALFCQYAVPKIRQSNVNYNFCKHTIIIDVGIMTYHIIRLVFNHHFTPIILHVPRNCLATKTHATWEIHQSDRNQFKTTVWLLYSISNYLF